MTERLELEKEYSVKTTVMSWLLMPEGQKTLANGRKMTYVERPHFLLFSGTVLKCINISDQGATLRITQIEPADQHPSHYTAEKLSGRDIFLSNVLLQCLVDK